METTTPNNQTILKVEGLKKYFPIRRGVLQRTAGWNRAVDGVGFEIRRGKTLGLVGESGCGKTTVARLVLRLLEPDAGRIVFNGLDISLFGEKEMRPLRKDMQIVFQDPYGSLNPRMTVGQSIGEGLRVAGYRNAENRGARLAELLQRVGMSPDSAERYPHEFSGGQRQRIGIARALSVSPSLIVCDEPISALDVSIQAQIINLLKDLQEQLALSYLFISHDLNVVGYLCDTILVMYRGRIMESAPAEEIFENPRHPYTRSLLSAIPGAESAAAATARFRGELPDDPVPGRGCAFGEQCPVEAPQCREGNIDFEKVGDDHYVRCCKAV